MCFISNEPFPCVRTLFPAANKIFSFPVGCLFDQLQATDLHESHADRKSFTYTSLTYFTSTNLFYFYLKEQIVV